MDINNIMIKNIFVIILIGFLLFAPTIQAQVISEQLDTPNFFEKWIFLDNDANYGDMRITPMSSIDNELRSWEFDWVMDDNNSAFWVTPNFEVSEKNPITEWHWKVNKRETNEICTASFFYRRCTIERLDFSTFLAKNNITNQNITELENGDIIYSFYGTITNLDPSFNLAIVSASTIVFNNQTEANQLGLHGDTPVLFMNFNNPPEGTYVQDNSIDNNFGTNNGATHNTSCDSPAGGSCYSFDGIDDAINISNEDNFDFGTGSFSISAWIKRESNSSNSYIVSKYNGVDGQQSYGFQIISNNSLRLFTSVDGVESTGFKSAYSGAIPVDGWHHVVVTKSGATATFYSDGVNVGSGTVDSSIFNSPTTPLIGAVTGPTGVINGSIDQVQIWDRALTAYEIKELYDGSITGRNNTNYIGTYSSEASSESLVYYNSTETFWNFTGSLADSSFSEIDTSDPNLVSYWRLDNSFVDSVGSNDGTPTGTTRGYGVVGEGRRLDGGNDYIDLPTATITSSQTEMAIGMWVNQNNVTDNGWIFSADKDGNDDIRIRYQNDRFICAFDDGSASIPEFNTLPVAGTSEDWVHALCQYNGTAGEMYINGVLAGSETDTFTFFDPLSVEVGKRFGTGNFSGKIDEILIYNDSLTATEILNIYNKQKEYYGIGIEGDVGLNNDSLIAYWPLDGNYMDAKGSNDGTANGTHNSTGVSSGAIHFDGVGEFVDLSPHVNNIEGYNQGSISTWFKTGETSEYIFSISNRTGDDNRVTLVVGGGLGSGVNNESIWYQLRRDGTPPKLTMYVANGNNSFFPYSDNEWHHVIAVMGDGDNRFYIDGVRMETEFLHGNSGTNEFTNINNANDMKIGFLVRLSGTFSFNGSLDEVQIYNKSLSDAEASALYKAGLSQHAETNITLETRTASTYNTTDPSLVAFWSFNNQNATDDSGNGNDGTNVGATWSEGNGTVGGGFSFDGIDDYIDINNVTDSNEGTISAWVYRNPGSSTEAIYSAGDSGSTAIPFSFNFRSSQLNLRVYNGSGASLLVNTNNTFDLNTWYHVATTSDGITNRMYVNGMEEETYFEGGETKSGAWLDDAFYTGNIRNDTIGAIARSTGLAGQFNGSIDELKIYNRSLSASEIESLYNLGSAHIEDWTDWKEEGKLVDGVPTTSSFEGNFFQARQRFSTDNTSTSAHLLNLSILANPDVFPLINFTTPTPTDGTIQGGNSVAINVTASDGNGIVMVVTNWWNTLISWFRFEGNSNDEQGVNNGTLIGTPTLTNDCMFGDCYDFDGANDYINVSDSTSLDIASEISLGVWFKDKSTNSGDGLVTKWNAITNNKSYRLATDYTSGSGILFDLSSDGFTTNLSLSADYNLNQWNHAVGTYNGSTTLLYLNGEEVNSSTSFLGEIFVTNQNVEIGRFNNQDIRLFNGTIDEVVIFNRSITANEVLALYNGTAYSNNFTNLADGVYPFQSFVQDTSGNLNQTEQREVLIDTTNPFINFTLPTPNNTEQVGADSFIVNITSTDITSPEHMVAVNFNNTLVSWWRFQDGADDQMGSNNGTVSGATFTSEGKYGNAYSFDGIDDFINVSGVENHPSFTVSLWFNAKGSGVQTIYSWGDSTSSSNFDRDVLRFNGANLDYWNGRDTDWDTFLNFRPITRNQWYHVSVVQDETNLKIYVNGEENVTGTITNYDLENDLGIGINLDFPTPNGPFNGTIDEVQIYNRALNLSEIQALYNATQFQYQNNFTDLALGNYTVQGFAQDQAGNLNQTEVRTIEVVSPTPPSTAFNTSLLGVRFDLADFVTDNNVYVENGKFQFNTSLPNESVVLVTSINVQNDIGGTGSVTPYLNITLGDEQIFEGPLSTVTWAGGSIDAKSTGTPPVNFTIENPGSYNITIWHRRDGSNKPARFYEADISLGKLETKGGGFVNFTIDLINAKTSSTTFASIQNFTINKNPGFTAQDYHMTYFSITADAPTTAVCRFNHDDGESFSPFMVRTITSSISTGTAALPFLTTDLDGTHNTTLECLSTTGANIEVNGTYLEFNMEDNNTNTIQGFQAGNPNTNYTNTLILPAGLNKIANATFTFSDGGDSILIGGTANFNSTSGIQTPQLIINSTLDIATCTSTKNRTTNIDVGNAFIYFICKNSPSQNETHNITMFIDVPAGEELELFDESLAGFETLSFDITTLNTAPNVEIIVPEADTVVNGTAVPVNWSIVEFQGDNYIINVTATNGTAFQNVTMNLTKGNSNTTWNTEFFANGFVNLTVTAFENETSQLLVGNDTHQVEVINDVGVIDLTSPLGNGFTSGTNVPLNFTVSTLPFNCQYSLNGAANVTIPSCNQSTNITFNGGLEGMNTLVLNVVTGGGTAVNVTTFDINTQTNTMMISPREETYSTTEQINITSFCKFTNSTLCGPDITQRVTAWYPNGTLYLTSQFMEFREQGRWTFTTSANSVVGEYSAAVTAYDSVGNVTAPFTFSVTTSGVIGAQACRYKKFGYYSESLPFFKEVNCI